MSRFHERARGLSPWSLAVDGIDARRSAKLGIPAAEVPLTPTGRQSEMYRRCAQGIADLRRRAALDTREAESELRRLYERLAQLDDQIAVASAEEARVMATPVQRLPIEDGVADAVVTTRRTRDNVKQAAPIRARIDTLTEERHQVALEAAEVDQGIAMRWREARAAANALREAAARRDARYFRLLCRRHPDGVRLAGLFDHARPGLPAWVDGVDDERSL